jgi:hypothetical protein
MSNCVAVAFWRKRDVLFGFRGGGWLCVWRGRGRGFVLLLADGPLFGCCLAADCQLPQRLAGGESAPRRKPADAAAAEPSPRNQPLPHEQPNEYFTPTWAPRCRVSGLRSRLGQPRKRIAG